MLELATMAGFVAKFGPFAFDAGSGELTRHGVAISLQNQSRVALMLLLEHPGALVTRDQFKETLWKDVNVDFENGLNTTIARLRQKLGTEYGSRIKAEPKQGYWFDAAVSIESTVAEDALAGAPSSDPLPVSTHSDPPLKRDLTLLGWIVRITAVAAVLCLLGWLVVRSGYFQERLPRVVRIDQITNDGVAKSRYIAADQDQVYLNEISAKAEQLFHVHGSGGKPHLAATPFSGDWPDPQDSNPTNGDVLVRLQSGLVVWSPVSNFVRRISPANCDLAKWSPDFWRIACSVVGSLYIMNADGSQQRLLRQVAGIEMLTWTPDGNRIRYSGRDQLGEALTLREVDASDGRNEQRLAPEQNPVIAGLFVRDLWFSISGLDNNVYVRSKNGQITALTRGPIKFYSLAESPLGTVLYATGQRGRGELMRYDKAGKEWRPYLEGVSADCLSWSSDGKYVAYVSYPDRELWRSRADGLEPLQLTSAPVQVYHPAWSPDGSQIAYEGRNKGGIWRLMVISRDGGPPKELAPRAEPDLQEREPVWSPDGRSIAFAPMDDASPPDELGLYLLDVKSEAVHRLPGSNGLFSPRWAPDQTGLLALTRQHAIVFYNLQNGMVKAITDGHKAWPHWARGGRDVCFLDGRRLTIGCVKRDGGPITDVAHIPFQITGNTFSGGWDASFWTAFAPDNTPVSLRDRGLSEIYAIQLKW